jgi:predicted dienelactone hydrolase
VVSHGMFGNADNQAWFAGAMARRGYVVAAINHPGTSTWSRDPGQRRQLWERPRDVSRVIDHAATSPKLSALVDPARVFMAGHSLGGFTAALLAGARYDASGLKRFCDKNPDELSCNILADWDVARTPEDIAQMEADLSDPRIKAFAVFDLGGTQSFSRASLGRVHTPMLMFGAPLMDSGLTLDIESRVLIEALPPETAIYIEPETLSHFDFLGQCKPGGFELLKREEPGDEIICRNGGVQRAAKHNLIIATVDGFFSRR